MIYIALEPKQYEEIIAALEKDKNDKLLKEIDITK